MYICMYVCMYVCMHVCRFYSPRSNLIIMMCQNLSCYVNSSVLLTALLLGEEDVPESESLCASLLNLTPLQKHDPLTALLLGEEDVPDSESLLCAPISITCPFDT